MASSVDFPALGPAQGQKSGFSESFKSNLRTAICGPELSTDSVKAQKMITSPDTNRPGKVWTRARQSSENLLNKEKFDFDAP
jgi:hypothetical protein